MTLLHIVCEGQTEETFVRDVLIAELQSRFTVVYSMVDTSPGHRGGGLSYPRVQRHLRNTLRQSNSPIVTTLFDLYRLDKDFPGHAEAYGKPLPQRLELLNAKFREDIVAAANCQPERFVPYIQPYEFEALLFSDIPALTSIETGWQGAAKSLQQIREGAETPEHINDGPNTKPAARLKQHLTGPAYGKTLHGPIAASLIGLPKIERECLYFAGWLNHLRNLALQ